jgi:hypothetical protein
LPKKRRDAWSRLSRENGLTKHNLSRNIKPKKKRRPASPLA